MPKPAHLAMSSPAVTLVVRRRSPAIDAVLDVARLRARDLGLSLEIVTLNDQPSAPVEVDRDGITAVVPVEFASRQHEAWCFLCQLSLIRRAAPVAILVLGAEAGAAFQARQRALLACARPTSAPARISRRRARAA